MVMLAVGLVLALAVAPASASRKHKETIAEPPPPDLLMDGGRRLSYERSFSLEREVKPKRSFWTKLVDVIAGRA